MCQHGVEQNGAEKSHCRPFPLTQISLGSFPQKQLCFLWFLLLCPLNTFKLRDVRSVSSGVDNVRDYNSEINKYVSVHVRYVCRERTQSSNKLQQTVCFIYFNIILHLSKV